MVRPLSRWWSIFVAAAGLLLLHWLLLLFVPSVAEMTYRITVPALEVFGRAGLPTLRGSPDGWAVPTQFGLVFSFACWYLVYSAVLCTFGAVRALLTRDATLTI